MPRGGHKVVKPAKTAAVETSAPSRNPSVPSLTTKSARVNADWKTSILTPTFRSRNPFEAKVSEPIPEQPPVVKDSACEPVSHPNLPVDDSAAHTNLNRIEGEIVLPNGPLEELEVSARPTSSRTSSAQSTGDEEAYEAAIDISECLINETTQSSSASSIYSRDSASIYSRASSVYSSGASIYSSGASIYSFEECGPEDGDRYARKGSASLAVKRSEAQDAASRERSSLARKAAMFKNSRLQPQLPSFSTSLPTWSMVCRAAQASQDCYNSRSLTRQGIYTPADSSKDIKAMIVDDQRIDESRLVIVAIRGTQCQSLTDWTVNSSGTPTRPVGFLDDEENCCHAGFLQVAKAMLSQVATQLQEHPAVSERPCLVFTGHSAGGAVAAMLYSHMVSTSILSDLTALASQFSSISCVTFGAPPVSVTPLPKRDHVSGVFLAFANEGDPVLRLSNAASFKTLAKLMTASPPAPNAGAVAAATPPPVKVVRGSRGGTVYRQALPAAPLIPWEELPLWPTPPSAMTMAGDIVLLRDRESGSASASRLVAEDLAEVIFGDFAQHASEMYVRRVKEVALAAMMGRDNF